MRPSFLNRRPGYSRAAAAASTGYALREAQGEQAIEFRGSKQ
jgi:hypothetical protein